MQWREADSAYSAWRNILAEIKWGRDLTERERVKALRVWGAARRAEEREDREPPARRARA